MTSETSERSTSRDQEVAGQEAAGREEPKTVQLQVVRSMRRRASRLRSRLAPYERVPVLNVLLRTIDLDRESGGPVLGSAIAFRLFLFFVPMLLLFVGISGLFSGVVSPAQVEQKAGVSGALADGVREALHQQGATQWLAIGFGLLGTLSAGRSLGRALFIASAISWREQVKRKAPLRTVGSIAGLIVGMALIAVLVNKLRQHFGVALAGLTFLPVAVVYAFGWLFVLMALPKRTKDPGALLPGALLMGLLLAAMHGFSELYLPDRFTRASQLYGAIGTTVVTLSWFFIFGRAVILTMELNAAIYALYGSVSQALFALPVLRILPRRFPRLRSFFGLDSERAVGAGKQEGD